MDLESIKAMWAAAQTVHEKKLDPVGKADGDIDNDGDEDESDEYLANRRKKIGKEIAKEEKDEDDSEEEEDDSEDDEKKSKKPKKGVNPFAEKKDDEEKDEDDEDDEDETNESDDPVKDEEEAYKDDKKPNKGIKKDDEEESDNGKPTTEKMKGMRKENYALESVENLNKMFAAFSEVSEASALNQTPQATNQSKNAMMTAGWQDNWSVGAKEFYAMHKRSNPDLEDLEDIESAPGTGVKSQAPSRRSTDNLNNGDSKSAPKMNKESVEFNEAYIDLMEANLPINMLMPGLIDGSKSYKQAAKEIVKDAWRALTGKQKKVIAKVHKLTQSDDELGKLYRDGWKSGGTSMKPGARKAFDARVKELLPNEETRDYVAAWKDVKAKVQSAMKDQKNESVEQVDEIKIPSNYLQLAARAKKKAAKEKAAKAKATKEEFESVEQVEEESDYQKKFKEMLAKTGKSLPDMSDEETKQFFQDVDDAYKAKSEMFDKNTQAGIDRAERGKDNDAKGIRALPDSVIKQHTKQNGKYTHDDWSRMEMKNELKRRKAAGTFNKK